MYDQNELISKLSYDGETGELRWLPRYGTRGSNAFNTKYAGNVATHIDGNGYKYISISGQFLLAHRVIWVMHNGPITRDQHVDHINHDRSDNRLVNLRIVKRSDNNKNRKPNSNTKFCVGVTYRADRETFNAVISVNRKRYNLGVFKSLFDAVCARKSAEIKHGFHANHGE